MDSENLTVNKILEKHQPTFKINCPHCMGHITDFSGNIFSFLKEKEPFAELCAISPVGTEIELQFDVFHSQKNGCNKPYRIIFRTFVNAPAGHIGVSIEKHHD